jgi:hypothetical protein
VESQDSALANAGELDPPRAHAPETCDRASRVHFASRPHPHPHLPPRLPSSPPTYGALSVAVVEVVIQAGYLRGFHKNKVAEKGKKEKKTVIGTWSVSSSLEEKEEEEGETNGKDKENRAVSFRAGKRR